jgi:hypothetical protein
VSGYIDVDDYESSTRSTDPVELLAEKDVAIGYLLGVIRERDAEIERLEGEVNHAYRELAGLV